MSHTARLCRGSALLITLAFLVLITILAAGLMDTVRTERISASSHLDALQAENFAQTGVERVVATLRAQTVQTGTTAFWISQPGMLIVSSSAGMKSVELSSGSAALGGTDASLRPPELNIPTFRASSNHLITEYTDSSGVALQMPVAWLYVRKSGTCDPVPTITADPIVGRYAYWAEDDSCRINYNIAWKKKGGSISPLNQAPVGDPSTVDLTGVQSFVNAPSAIAITEEWANQLHQFPFGFYNTPGDVRQIANKELATALNVYGFDLTHYNSDPDRNVFNQPRIVLTTQASRVPQVNGTAALPFLDILTTPNTDPGNPANIDDAKFNTVLAQISDYLKANNWVMAPGSSFAGKYYSGFETQLAINIIDYVRCVESGSSNNIVPPSRGGIQSNGLWKSGNSGGTQYIGVSRSPCITEVGLTKSGSVISVKVELFSPPRYSLRPIQLNQLAIYIDVNGTSEEYLIPNSEASSTTLVSGTYATISHTFTTKPPAVSGTLAQIRVALALSPGSNRIDFAGFNGYLKVPVNGASLEADDPRTNKAAADWALCMAPVGNTFGSKNSRYQTTSVSGGPQQDTDSGGALSEASLYMPPCNTSGTAWVSSVGELGYVHTGVRSSAAGVPWRTIRLQPNNDAAGTVPDWALLDLFTVPANVSGSANPTLQPNGNSYGGRININSHLQPFDNLTRILPVTAALKGCATSSNSAATLGIADAQRIAKNIFDWKRASTQQGDGKLYGLANAYYSPYQIVEIDGVASSGEESEELVRQVSNLLTTRSNVFTVYSVGESLKQTPSGRLVATGQKRLQATIERYLDSDTNQTQFRTIYYRNLTP
ncbi:MAG: hypothetical protein ACFUZC_17405 [Chthoniobacteraceae bacterium]